MPPVVAVITQGPKLLSLASLTVDPVAGKCQFREELDGLVVVNAGGRGHLARGPCPAVLTLAVRGRYHILP